MKSCCFFGHSNIYDKDGVLSSLLIEKIESLIVDGFAVFYFGGYGDFDSLSHKAVRTLKRKYPDIKTIYVQAYYKPNDKDDEFLKDWYDETLYPALEDKPLRFAISYRNQNIIVMSDYCIFCVNREYGGAFQALQYAKRKKKDLLNIGEI